MADEKKTTDGKHVYEDEHYKYTTVGAYVKNGVSHWVDQHPGKALGLALLGVTVISCGIFQGMCTHAVYKGSVKAYKYLLKHYK